MPSRGGITFLFFDMTTEQLEKSLDYKRQIKERVENWLLSFISTENIVSEQIINVFYDDAALAPFDSLGRFRYEQLPLMIGKPFQDFADALRNLEVKVNSPFNECIIYFPK